MIVNPRITDYIGSLEPGNGAFLDSLAREAWENRIPVIRPETGAFLKTQVAAVKPRRILEVGTAVGYSALLMSRVMPQDCHITTIEKYGKRIPQALENFRRAGEESRITLLEGDAGEILESLDGFYELIFMDGAKGQYLSWLPHMLRLLPVGGMLISDNVLQDGTIIESRFAVERRNRTIHCRMREYLYLLKHTAELETSVIPIGDGVTVSVRVRDGGA